MLLKLTSDLSLLYIDKKECNSNLQDHLIPVQGKYSAMPVTQFCNITGLPQNYIVKWKGCVELSDLVYEFIKIRHVNK